MTRLRLPNRRPSRTIRMDWPGHKPFHVTVGLCPATGHVMEVFYSDGMLTGADLLHTVQDGCVMVSLLLQQGLRLAEIARSLSCDGIVGAVVAAVIADAVLPPPPLGVEK